MTEVKDGILQILCTDVATGVATIYTEESQRKSYVDFLKGKFIKLLTTIWCKTTDFANHMVMLRRIAGRKVDTSVLEINIEESVFDITTPPRPDLFAIIRDTLKSMVFL